jgi:hypothetical protein
VVKSLQLYNSGLHNSARERFDESMRRSAHLPGRHVASLRDFSERLYTTRLCACNVARDHTAAVRNRDMVRLSTSNSFLDSERSQCWLCGSNMLTQS